MCGITGLYAPQYAAIDKLCQQSLALIKHRGPDSSGIFQNIDHGVALGHARLAIIDLSPMGYQPMHSLDGQVIIVFNGEVYNFSELRVELEKQGHTFRGHSDTEVLLNLYLSVRNNPQGIAKMLRQINGVFALAIWDADCEAMLLARDSFGVKPLYYSAGDRGFAFASEIKALSSFATAIFDESFRLNDLDVSALDRYLTYLWCPGSQTPTQRVKKLLPGQAMWVKQGRISETFTWHQLPVSRQLVSHRQKIRPMKLTEFISGTEQYLRQAVHRQLVADVPVGAFLSGGLDSSAIVAFAREQNPDIRCFTIESIGGQESGFADDLPYARRVAKHLGVSLDVVRIDANRMASDLERMVWQLDEPLADPAPLNVLYISQLARQHGIKVLLSGAGGDDLFTGYRRHRALMAEKWWVWLPISARRKLAQFSGSLDQSRVMGRRLVKLFSGAALDGDARLVNYFRWVQRDDLDRLYSDEFRSALNGSKAEAPMLNFLKDFPSKTSRLERMLAVEQRFFLTDHNLTYTDKMSMAVGVEVRVPFLDLDLVEFASHIPAKYKQSGKEGKWVLKKAMEPYLPHDVIYRPKSGFGAPLRRWMRFELREMLGDFLSVESLQKRGLFNPTAVQQLISNNDTGRVDASYTLLSLLCIEIWCRQFLDQTIVQDNIKNNRLIYEASPPIP